MKKIILALLISLLNYPVFAQELQDTTTKTGAPVILQRKTETSKTQTPEVDDNLQKPEKVTEKQPSATEKTPKQKSNKPKYSGLIIYDKPENEPCENCYYYYEHKAGKYRKNTFYDRKAMTKKEKDEKIKKSASGSGSIFNKMRGKGEKICK